MDCWLLLYNSFFAEVQSYVLHDFGPCLFPFRDPKEIPLPKLIAYWITTALLAGVYLTGGYFDIAQLADFHLETSKLGYPLYFFTILGVWKIGAAIAIVAPALPRLKEWAYAGILFNLTGAAASHVFIKDTLGETITPLIVLAIAAASWYLRPADRRLAGPWL